MSKLGINYKLRVKNALNRLRSYEMQNNGMILVDIETENIKKIIVHISKNEFIEILNVLNVSLLTQKQYFERFYKYCK